MTYRNLLTQPLKNNQKAKILRSYDCKTMKLESCFKSRDDRRLRFANFSGCQTVKQTDHL